MFLSMLVIVFILYIATRFVITGSQKSNFYFRLFIFVNILLQIYKFYSVIVIKSRIVLSSRTFLKISIPFNSLFGMILSY